MIHQADQAEQDTESASKRRKHLAVGGAFACGNLIDIQGSIKDQVNPQGVDEETHINENK